MSAAGLPLTRGWARPVNHRDGLHHWWRPDAKRACDPTGSVGYSGPTSHDLPDLMTEVCLDCVVEVVAAARVLGYPQPSGLMGLEPEVLAEALAGYADDQDESALQKGAEAEVQGSMGDSAGSDDLHAEARLLADRADAARGLLRKLVGP